MVVDFFILVKVLSILVIATTVVNFYIMLPMFINVAVTCLILFGIKAKVMQDLRGDYYARYYA